MRQQHPLVADLDALERGIDEAAAGGSEVILIAIIVILVLELTGVIDIFK